LPQINADGRDLIPAGISGISKTAMIYSSNTLPEGFIK